MTNSMTWFPRILGLLYVILIASFALDSFSGDEGLLTQTGQFVIHLIPAFVAAGILAVSWRYPLIGGICFMVLGMIFTVYFGTYNKLSNFLIVSMPLFLIGVLFMLTHRKRLKITG